MDLKHSIVNINGSWSNLSSCEISQRYLRLEIDLSVNRVLFLIFCCSFEKLFMVLSGSLVVSFFRNFTVLGNGMKPDFEICLFRRFLEFMWGDGFFFFWYLRDFGGMSWFDSWKWEFMTYFIWGFGTSLRQIRFIR